MFVSVQPDSLTVEGLTAGVTRGVRILYPNATFEKPGSRAHFWKYDPNGKGWYIYGYGEVTADGRQVAPDAGVESFDTIGFMYNPANQGSDAAPGTAPAPNCRSGNPPDKPGCPRPKEGEPKESKSAGGFSGGAPSMMAGDPVDTSTGMLVHSSTDLSVTDILPVYLTRNYRPGDSVIRPFGLGTSHTFATYLYAPVTNGIGNTEVSMVMSDGSTRTFPRISISPRYVYEYTGSDPQLYKAKITLSSRPESNQTLGRWVLRRRDGSEMEFDSFTAGYGLTRITDTSGNTVQFVRNGGRITRMLSPSGRYIDFTYDTSNRISRAEDISGRVVTYDYTAACTANGSPQGYLCKVTDPDNKVEEYKYDSLGRMTQIKDKRGNVVVTNTYDTNSRVIQQDYPGAATVIFSYTTDGSGNVTQTNMTDARGLVTRMQFNPAKLMTSRIEAFGTALARTTTYEYRSTDNLLLATVDPIGRRTEYDYDTHWQCDHPTQPCRHRQPDHRNLHLHP